MNSINIPKYTTWILGFDYAGDAFIIKPPSNSTSKLDLLIDIKAGKLFEKWIWNNRGLLIQPGLYECNVRFDSQTDTNSTPINWDFTITRMEPYYDRNR